MELMNTNYLTNRKQSLRDGSTQNISVVTDILIEIEETMN